MTSPVTPATAHPPSPAFDLGCSRPALEATCARLLPAAQLHQACSDLLAPLVQASGAARGSLMVINRATGQLHIAAAVGLPQDIVGRDVPPRARSISDWVLRNRRGLVLNGEVRDQRFEGSSSDAVRESALSLPLTTSTVVGVLNLTRRAPAPAFGDPELALADSLLAPVAATVERLQRGADAERTFSQLDAMPGARPSTLVPRGGLELPGYEIGLAHVPGMRRGGDMCERVPHSGGNTMLVADVVGDGAAAAIAAAFTQGSFVGSASRECSAATLVTRLNADLHTRLGDRRYVTLWAAQLSMSGELCSCNAGYPPPFWVPSDGVPLPRLHNGGCPAGAFAKSAYEEERLRLLPGDLVVAVSDGVLEARDGAQQRFGEERVAEILGESRRRPLDQLTTAVCEGAAGFTGRPVPVDDFMVFAIRFAPGT